VKSGTSYSARRTSSGLAATDQQHVAALELRGCTARRAQKYGQRTGEAAQRRPDGPSSKETESQRTAAKLVSNKWGDDRRKQISRCQLAS
jgi:hypothetical protein